MFARDLGRLILVALVVVIVLALVGSARASSPPPRHAFPSRHEKVWVCPLSAVPPHDPVVSACFPDVRYVGREAFPVRHPGRPHRHPRP